MSSRPGSGQKYYTLRGLLAACSSVFRDIIESCGGEIVLEQRPEPKSSDSKSKTTIIFEVMEIPLDDTKEEVKALMEHLHQPDRLLGSLIPEVTKEGAEKVLRLASIALKYDLQGARTSFHTCTGVVALFNDVGNSCLYAHARNANAVKWQPNAPQRPGIHMHGFCQQRPSQI